MKRLNFYDCEEVTICPYCGSQIQIEPHMGCCGEVHSDTAILHQDEIYAVEEVELYKPILDMIRYEILNKWVWRSRIQRLRYRLENRYNGYNSLCLKFRQLTRFYETRLDCIILNLITTRIHFTKTERIEMERYRDEWNKTHNIDPNQYTLIPKNEK